MNHLKFHAHPRFLKEFIDLCDLLMEEVRAGKVSLETRNALEKAINWLPHIQSQTPAVIRPWRGPEDAA